MNLSEKIGIVSMVMILISICIMPATAQDPTVAITADPAIHAATIGLDFTFRATLSGSWGNNIHYSWSCDNDDTNLDCPPDWTDTGQSISAEAVCYGTHTISVTVTDELGNSATDSYSITVYTQDELKQQIINRISEFFGKYEGKCFNDWITLGDINKVKDRLDDSDVQVYIDPKHLKRKKAVALYENCVGFYCSKYFNDIILPDHPNSVKVEARTLYHEAMHAIFDLHDSELLVDDDEIYTEYMENVDTNLDGYLDKVEEEIKKGKNCDCDMLKKRWQRFVNSMEYSKNTSEGSITSDAQIQQLKDLTGLDVNVDTIKQHYEAGDCVQCVKLENAICGDHDEDGIGSACDDSPCGDNAHLLDCTCYCNDGWVNYDGDWSNGCECKRCPADSKYPSKCYKPGTKEEGCCEYDCEDGTCCYDGNRDLEECRVCYDGTWYSGWHCEEGECIPEFATIAIPVVAIIGLMFLISRRKQKDRIKRN